MLKLEWVYRNLNERQSNILTNPKAVPSGSRPHQDVTCTAAFGIQHLHQSDSSAHAALMALSTYLYHLCRCWRSCCSRCFGIDTGFCSLAELVRSESFPLPGLAWSSAETERDYINVKLLGYFLCNPAGCTPTPTLVWSRAGCSEAQGYLAGVHSGESALEHGCQHWAHHLLWWGCAFPAWWLLGAAVISSNTEISKEQIITIQMQNSGT